VSQENESGFEYEGRFYEWRFGATGKDLMLIDRICGMSLSELYEAVDQGRDRPSLMLAMIALSLRAGNPSWSVERIMHIVEEIDTGTDIKLLGVEEPPSPPAETAAEPPTSEPSKSPSNGSSPLSTQPDGSSFKTSFAAPV
jgi:hypothetical protein